MLDRTHAAGVHTRNARSDFLHATKCPRSRDFNHAYVVVTNPPDWESRLKLKATENLSRHLLSSRRA